MLILGLLGMYFDAAVVFVTNSSLLFRLAVAILCLIYISRFDKIGRKKCPVSSVLNVYKMIHPLILPVAFICSSATPYSQYGHSQSE